MIWLAALVGSLAIDAPVWSQERQPSRRPGGVSALSSDPIPAKNWFR